MYKFLLTLHVLSAVLLIGPFVLVAFMGDRAIRRHDAEDIHRSARYMARFAIGSALVAVLGAAALGLSDRYTFRTPWVIISLTLWLVAMGVATGYTVPALRRAAHIVEHDEQEEKERLANITGRVVGSAGLVLVCFVIITIMMTARPFGT